MRQTLNGYEWPALEYEDHVWSSSIAEAGPAATRLSAHGRRYQTAVPARIAALTPAVSTDIAKLGAEAERELSTFDTAHGDGMRAFGPILLRSEAAASSQIENLTASARSIFTAELGGKSKKKASLIAANTRTMEAAIDLAGDLSTESIREMHRVLLASEPRHTPGEYRDQPVWIGRNANSPVGAVYVAPHESCVSAFMEDLSVFASRYDLRPLMQVAIAHAQFETIHPFTDGNGRTGRALAQAMIRRAHLTNNVAVPVSAGLLTDIGGYHQALTDYRSGNVEPIIEQFAVAALRAVPNGRKLVGDISAIHELALEKARPRRGSAKRRLVEYVMRQPVFTAEIAATAVGVSPTNLYRDLSALEEAGVIVKSVEHRGPTIYRSPEVLAAIDAFAERAARRTRFN